jgi:hypothetical protein
VESFLWNSTISGPIDIDYAPDDTLWSINTDFERIFRFVDRNDDGDYNDALEAAEVYRGGAAIGFNTAFARTLSFAPGPDVCPGDMDCDGDIDFDDISPFVQAIGNDADAWVADYIARYGVEPVCNYANADLDGDLDTDFDDISPFVAAIGTFCP